MTTLSVRKLWIGFDKTIDGVVLIANKGLPTEQRWALGPWSAIEGGAALAQRGALLLRQQLFVDDIPSDVEADKSQPPTRQDDEPPQRFDA